ncbi:Glutathione S-transferase kappa 1 [Dinochytrium kinnereticum]|nr:Glutathione S-transferase kappa 1 [Dinochytrium kinnereticum]
MTPSLPETDLPNLSKLHEVPLQFPNNFPENSLRAQRILTAIQMKNADKLEEASRQLWRLYWRDGKSLQSDDDLLEYLTPVLTKELAQKFISEYSVLPDVKERLIAVTKDMVENEGAFGAPWFVVEREDGERMSFFGSDRMEAMAFFLKKPYLGAVPSRLSRL